MNKQTIVKYVKAEKLHGRYQLEQNFNDRVNIIHGKNGTGKTTLLHILANALNGNYDRFVYLDFKSIDVHLNNDVKLKILQKEKYTYVEINGKTIKKLDPEKVIEFDNEKRKLREDYRRHDIIESEKEEFESKPILPAAYFPAFRTMIEAWAAQNRGPRRVHSRAYHNERKVFMTEFARRLFGPFVPVIVYSSILDIEIELERNIELALIKVARKDRELLSQSFLNILPALNPDQKREGQQKLEPSRLLVEIKELLQELQDAPFEYKPLADINIYDQLRKTVKNFPTTVTQEGVGARILNLYKQLLLDRISEQKEVFKEIERYLNSVNEFLDEKEISVGESLNRHNDASIVVSFSDGSESNLRTLSSGERQILTLLYAATKMSKQEVVLIDEPEISLHVDWQRSLINKMSSQLSNRQIITCTHSPIIGADYEKAKQELQIIN